jgi:hypothetical protein
MDSKERLLVTELYSRIEKVSFHERDILSLLILLRPRTAPLSPLRELSDFIAHREKDRGALKAYVKHVVDYVDALVTNTSGLLKIDVVHTREAFRESLNATLSEYDLAPLDEDLSDDVLTCAMSLLQAVRLIDSGNEIGHLGLVRMGKELHLSAQIVVTKPHHIPIVFPALIVPNRYCEPTKSGGIQAFLGLVEARCTKGKLTLNIGGKAVA